MNKSDTITDPKLEAQMEDFAKWLYDGGYSEETARSYMNSAAKYIVKGHDTAKEKVEAYYNLKLADTTINRTQRRKLYVQKAGVMRYTEYLEGKELNLMCVKKQKKTKKNCNKDCFNCIYPDCIYD